MRKSVRHSFTYMALATCLGVLISLNSCLSIRSYPAEMLYPASVEIPFEGEKLVLLSSREIIKDQAKVNYASWEMDSLLYNEVLVASSIIFTESPEYQIINVSVDTSKLLNPSEKELAVFIDNVKPLLPDSTDILLFLESLGMEYQAVDRKAPGNDEGKYSHVIVATSIWRICDIHGESFVFYSHSDTVNLDYHEFNLLRGGESSQKMKTDFYMGIAYEHGLRTGRKMTPSWYETERLFFHNPIFFGEAAKMVGKEEWLKALEIWQPLTEHSLKMISGPACYNMAVASEMNGQTDLALEWLGKVKYKGITNYVNYYQLILQQREEFQKLLDMQIN